MTPKARPLRNHLPSIAISVEELFSAAFHKARGVYLRESLLGWRPLTSEPTLPSQKDPPPLNGQAPRFSNSPDVKIRETSDAIVIEVELPDIDEESLYLEVSGDLLIIRAKRVIAGQAPTGTHASDQPAMVHRYVKLPVVARPGNVQARLDGPLLRIKIGKPIMGTLDKDPMER